MSVYPSSVRLSVKSQRFTNSPKLRITQTTSNSLFENEGLLKVTDSRYVHCKGGNILKTVPGGVLITTDLTTNRKWYLIIYHFLS